MLHKPTLDAVTDWAIENKESVSYLTLMVWLCDQIVQNNHDIIAHAGELCQQNRRYHACQYLYKEAGWPLKDCKSFIDKNFPIIKPEPEPDDEAQ